MAIVGKRDEVISAPVFYKMMATANEQGEMSTDFHLFLDQHSQAVNQIATQHNEGIRLPSLPTGTITSLAANAPNGTLWYDSTTDEIKGKVANSVQVIFP